MTVVVHKKYAPQKPQNVCKRGSKKLKYDDRVGLTGPRKLRDLDRETQCAVRTFLEAQDPTEKMSSFGAWDLPDCITECELMAAVVEVDAEDDITVGEFLEKHLYDLLPAAA